MRLCTTLDSVIIHCLLHPLHLPSHLPQMRSTQHLGLRLRDQLLAFASVCALKMQPGQLAPLGLCFDSLASLSLSGKVALDGQLLQELTAALSGSTARRGTRSSARGASSSSEGAGSSSRGSSRGGNRARQLQSLCLDVHFVGVSAADVRGALAALTELKVGPSGRCPRCCLDQPGTPHLISVGNGQREQRVTAHIACISVCRGPDTICGVVVTPQRARHTSSSPPEPRRPCG